MILLIGGASHTGKTLLADKLVKRYGYACISQDLIKMGLIRSGITHITATDIDALRPYLWNITKEIIKTAIENKQNLIVEGCYIPANYREYFDERYTRDIRFVCLIMSEKYIRANFDKIKSHANDIENRLDDSDLELERLIRCNDYFLCRCKECDAPYLLIDDKYSIDWNPD